MSFKVGDLVTWYWNGVPCFKVEVLAEPDADGEFTGEVLAVYDDDVVRRVGERRQCYFAHNTVNNLGRWLLADASHSIEHCLKPLQEVELKHISVRLERIPDCNAAFPDCRYRVVVTDWELQERTGLSADCKYNCKTYAEALRLFETLTQSTTDLE